MKNFSKLKFNGYILLFLAAIVSNELQAKDNGFNLNHSESNLFVVTANEMIPGNDIESAKRIAFQKMQLGLFVHYRYVGKSYQWGSTQWADNSKVKNLDELADNLDVNDLAEMASAMRAQYIIFTPFHANMQVLYPSKVMKDFLPGHCSKRDVIRDLINALKARNIRLLLYFHPSDGHDLTKADQELTGWNDGGSFKRWNDFINTFLGELIDRYGKNISGYFIDGGLPKQVDAARLRKTIISRFPASWIIQNAGYNPLCADFSAKEDNMVPPFPATSWVRCQRITAEWWANMSTVTWNPELAYRYTILQSAVSNRVGGGTCWSFGPYPGGRWEPGVRSFCKDLGRFIDKAGDSFFGTRPGKAYPSKDGQPLLGTQFVTTESPDGKMTYLHVFLPPKGQVLELPAPANKRHFNSARLFSNNQAIHLRQTDSSVYLTLPPTDRWDDLDTIIVLE